MVKAEVQFPTCPDAEVVIKFVLGAACAVRVYDMASSAKRRAVGIGQNPEEGTGESSEATSEDEGDSGEEESNDSEEEVNEEVIVDFEAHTISDSDFNGIRKLLQQLFLKANVDLSELTDIVIQQNHIGSVIRQGEVDDSDDEDDPDEVYGFISLLNLSDRKDVPCVEQLKDLLLGQCEKADARFSRGDVQQLEAALGDVAKPIGLLLSERFINVPPQIALPLYRQLQEEVTEAQRTNKPNGKCHHWLMISKTYVADKSVSRKPKAVQEDLMFSNAEEEFFYEQASLSYSYSVQEEADSCLGGRWSFDDVPMKPLRTVMLIPVDRLGAIMKKLKEYLTV